MVFLKCIVTPFNNILYQFTPFKLFAPIKASRRHGQLDVSPKATIKEIIQLCINTLTSDAITPEEETLGYFIRKKLQ